MKTILGRRQESAELQRLYDSKRAEFVAVYGRRRVGKTFLVREFFKDKMTVYHTALSPNELDENNLGQQQLQNFLSTLVRSGAVIKERPKNWFEAFDLLISFLETFPKNQRLVVFIDEMPWLDTPRSGFMTAFEHFWNGWGAGQHNLLLIVCGSATSWITNQLINNHGGLYGRLTYEMHLMPFSLKETEEYLTMHNIVFDRYDIVQLYMITGGIPFYLDYIGKGRSLAQNIDMLFFAPDGRLRIELERLFSSLFVNAEQYLNVVRILSEKREGYNRRQIAEKAKIPYGGGLTKILKTLEQSDFIQSYIYYKHSRREVYYKLIDFFSLFFLRFVEPQKNVSPTYWQDNLQSPKLNAWRGFSFELVCFEHQQQIKKALGIDSVHTLISPWRSTESDEKAQIDLIIERADRIINLCEIKFSIAPYKIDKSYDAELRRKMQIFQEETKSRYGLHLTMITTYGLQHNEYSNHVQSVITMDDMFV